jgi:hypothetical protein
MLMFGEREGGVEFDPEDLVCVRGIDTCYGGVRAAGERVLPLLQRAPLMRHFLTLTVMPVYSLKRESFWSWMDMLVGESVAKLRSSAKPWPGGKASLMKKNLQEKAAVIEG